MFLLNSIPVPYPLTTLLSQGSEIPSGFFAEYLNNGDINDSSGNGLDKTAPNGVSYAPGKFGQAAATNGTNQSMVYPSDARWDDLQGRDFTMALWLKTFDTSNLNQVTGNYSTDGAFGPTPNQFWATYVFPDGKFHSTYRRDNSAETLNMSSISSAVDGNFNLVGFCKKGLDLEIWFNAVRENVITLSADGSVGNNQAVKDALNYARYFAAQYDNQRFWDRGLDQSEWTQLLNEIAA